jgi:outer membrane immunogenic protein
VNNYLFAFAATATALFASTGAHAQTYQGPFVGVQGGWNHDKVANAPWKSYDLGLNKSKDAFSGGVYAGYDHMFTPEVLVGLEAGLSASAKDRLVRRESGVVVELDPKYAVDVTARTGLLLSPATLIYARGGYVNLRTDTRQSGKDGVLHEKSNLGGWTAGAGLEHLLAPGVSTRLEYRYSKLSGDRSDVKRQQVLLGASFRF